MFGKYVTRKELNEYVVRNAKYVTALKLKIFNLEQLLIDAKVIDKKILDVINGDLNKTLR